MAYFIAKEAEACPWFFTAGSGRLPNSRSFSSPCQKVFSNSMTQQVFTEHLFYAGCSIESCVLRRVLGCCWEPQFQIDATLTLCDPGSSCLLSEGHCKRSLNPIRISSSSWRFCFCGSAVRLSGLDTYWLMTCIPPNLNLAIRQGLDTEGSCLGQGNCVSW